MGFLNNLVHGNDLKVINVDAPTGIDLDTDSATINLTLQGGNKDRSVSSITVELVRVTQHAVRNNMNNGFGGNNGGGISIGIGGGNMSTQTERVTIRKHKFNNNGKPWLVADGETVPVSLDLPLDLSSHLAGLVGPNSVVDPQKHPFLATLQQMGAANMRAAMFELKILADVDGIMLDPTETIDVNVRNLGVNGY